MNFRAPYGQTWLIIYDNCYFSTSSTTVFFPTSLEVVRRAVIIKILGKQSNVSCTDLVPLWPAMTPVI